MRYRSIRLRYDSYALKKPKDQPVAMVEAELGFVVVCCDQHRPASQARE